MIKQFIIRDGRIAALGAAAAAQIPPDAQVMDLTGKSVIPGLVMVHEHLYYPTGPGVYGNLVESFTQLYLAGGVTSMRTGGNMNGYGELAIKRAIDRGDKPGPMDRRDRAVSRRTGSRTRSGARADRARTTRAGSSRSGTTPARRRSRRTCTSRATSCAPRSTRDTSAA